MPLTKFRTALEAELAALEGQGLSKAHEHVIVRVHRPGGRVGTRVFLEGHGDRPFLRMNANNYLGLSTHPRPIQAEEETVHSMGVGPGAVRFIAGTFQPHVELEEALARFHGREACMITSAAYTAVLGVLAALTTPETVIISDELNHNCIINAMKLARPKERKIYRHLDPADLERHLAASVGSADCALVVTDGVFSMRGDIAPLDVLQRIVERYDEEFPRGAVLLVDDSHGVGTLGAAGRGAEELTRGRGDILIATLGKAFGVNGGYIASEASVVAYLREKNPLYIFTNPITPPEAAAALQALAVVDSAEGRRLIAHLHFLTQRFEQGLVDLGFETISSPHPVVPLIVRDTERTRELVRYLYEHNILATGLNYPVVPRGEELIRFQVAADLTVEDIDLVLDVLRAYRGWRSGTADTRRAG